MNSARAWNILCWNVHGLNDNEKWDPIRNKIDESNANIFCLQETKRETFDLQNVRKFAPKRFDKFDYCPSVGASGGILVCWSSSYFSVSTLEKQKFAIKLLVTSSHNLEAWTLVLVYGPCRQWLHNLDIGDDDLWLLIGDFNFYRTSNNRNRPGGNFNDTLIFNNIISHLGLIELPIKGRSYTWSNMQDSPLLEQVSGSLPLLLGLINIPSLWCFLWPKSHHIISHVKFKLALVSPRQIYLDLRIIGSVSLDV